MHYFTKAKYEFGHLWSWLGVGHRPFARVWPQQGREQVPTSETIPHRPSRTFALATRMPPRNLSNHLLRYRGAVSKSGGRRPSGGRRLLAGITQSLRRSDSTQLVHCFRIITEEDVLDGEEGENQGGGGHGVSCGRPSHSAQNCFSSTQQSVRPDRCGNVAK